MSSLVGEQCWSHVAKCLTAIKLNVLAAESLKKSCNTRVVKVVAWKFSGLKFAELRLNQLKAMNGVYRSGNRKSTT